VISIRQKLLAIPGKLYSRLGEERFPHEAARECEKLIHEILNELSSFRNARSLIGWIRWKRKAEF
jgi:hypothetical protein